jgi:arsenate reductase-like glutaredoxin family protein
MNNKVISAIVKRSNGLKNKFNGPSLHEVIKKTVVDTEFLPEGYEDCLYSGDFFELYIGGYLSCDEKHKKTLDKFVGANFQYDEIIYSATPCTESLKSKLETLEKRIKAWNQEKLDIEEELNSLAPEMHEAAEEFVSKNINKN